MTYTFNKLHSMRFQITLKMQIMSKFENECKIWGFCTSTDKTSEQTFKRHNWNIAFQYSWMENLMHSRNYLKLLFWGVGSGGIKIYLQYYIYFCFCFLILWLWNMSFLALSKIFMMIKIQQWWLKAIFFSLNLRIWLFWRQIYRCKIYLI